MDHACEVNEKGTRNKNDGNELVNNCDLPLDLEHISKKTGIVQNKQSNKQS